MRGLRDQERGTRIEHCDGLLPCHRREVLEERVDRFAALEIVEECLCRNTCADENDRTAHDLWITVNRKLHCTHGSLQDYPSGELTPTTAARG